MRIFPALVGALLVTLLIFLFMHGLIEYGQQESVPVAVYNDVQIVHAQRETPTEQQPKQEVASEAMDEPAMEPLAASAAAPLVAAPLPADKLEIPALDLGVGDVQVASVGERWRGPLTGSGSDGAGPGSGGNDVVIGGKDAQGYIEVVPFDTRRPNVPEVAWQNKIDGWVLVAFSVTSEGRTRDVRVLDASPRGVFEDLVIAAVEDWMYRVNVSGDLKGDVVVTQKVEVKWQNYPQNLPNVD